MIPSFNLKKPSPALLIFKADDEITVFINELPLDRDQQYLNWIH